MLGLRPWGTPYQSIACPQISYFWGARVMVAGSRWADHLSTVKFPLDRLPAIVAPLARTWWAIGCLRIQWSPWLTGHIPRSLIRPFTINPHFIQIKYTNNNNNPPRHLETAPTVEATLRRSHSLDQHPRSPQLSTVYQSTTSSQTTLTSSK
jgi:hypothetical protein